MRTRVKICGVTTPEHARAAASAGADAIGLVFYAASVRALELEQARRINQSVSPFVASVALFLDPDAALVKRVIQYVGPDMLQFHGNESPEFCRSFELPYLKAVPMGADIDPANWADRYHDAAGLLLDSHQPGEAGGSGQRFDWQRSAQSGRLPIIAAGGLNSDNVGEAIRNMRPYAVDVSSGVESRPGNKDSALIQTFIEAVHRADRG